MEPRMTPQPCEILVALQPHAIFVAINKAKLGVRVRLAKTVEDVGTEWGERAELVGFPMFRQLAIAADL
jgi:hypothetical protein